MSDNDCSQNSQNCELLSSLLAGSGDSCETKTSSMLPSDTHMGESIFLTFYLLPEHRVVELGDVSVNDKLHDVLSRVEKSVNINGCALAFIVVSGQIVKDRSVTVGSLFIPATTADASGNVEKEREKACNADAFCGNIYGTYLDRVAIMQAKLVSYTSIHNSGILSTSTTGTGYTCYSFSCKTGARVKRLSREINEFFLKNPSPNFALCPSEDPNSVSNAGGSDDSICMQGKTTSNLYLCILSTISILFLKFTYAFLYLFLNLILLKFYLLLFPFFQFNYFFLSLCILYMYFIYSFYLFVFY
jgi:hypothetical protein